MTKREASFLMQYCMETYILNKSTGRPGIFLDWICLSLSEFNHLFSTCCKYPKIINESEHFWTCSRNSLIPWSLILPTKLHLNLGENITPLMMKKMNFRLKNIVIWTLNAIFKTKRTGTRNGNTKTLISTSKLTRYTLNVELIPWHMQSSWYQRGEGA